MHVVLFGATGRIGSRVAIELSHRGHSVTGVGRTTKGANLSLPRTTWVRGDVTDPEKVARVARGHDAAVSAIGPTGKEGPATILKAASALITGLHHAGVPRLVVVGEAGSLEVGLGVLLLDTPKYPADWKPVAEAHRAALEAYRQEKDLEWTYLSPAGTLLPGVRTGRYRTGSDQLLVDSRGVSTISMEDLAVAIVDELETPRHVRRRFTVASV